jgi:hypothetical protein
MVTRGLVKYSLVVLLSYSACTSQGVVGSQRAAGARGCEPEDEYSGGQLVFNHSKWTFGPTFSAADGQELVRIVAQVAPSEPVLHVGLSPDGTRASVFVGVVRAALDGSGRVFILHKVEGKWMLVCNYEWAS